MHKKIKNMLKNFKPPSTISIGDTTDIPYTKGDGKIYSLDPSGNETIVSSSNTLILSDTHSPFTITVPTITNKTINTGNHTDYVDYAAIDLHINNTLPNMGEISHEDFVDHYMNILEGKTSKSTHETVERFFSVKRYYDSSGRPIYALLNEKGDTFYRCFIHNDFFIFRELGT